MFVVLRIKFVWVGILLVLLEKLFGSPWFVFGLVQTRLGILDNKHSPHGACLGRAGRQD
jgi:hypothetical protein